MMLKKTLAASFTALALAGIAAGTASADDGNSAAKFNNEENVLNCDSVRVIDVPILSANNDNIDCSRNFKHNEANIHVEGEEGGY